MDKAEADRHDKMLKLAELLTEGSTEEGDVALFGLLWPLGDSVKLDSTIDRRALRAQIARLGDLGYALDFKTQEWSRQAELQPA